MNRTSLIAAASVLALGVAGYGLSLAAAPARAPVVNSHLATDRPSTVPQTMAQVQLTFAPVVKRIAPAVVTTAGAMRFTTGAKVSCTCAMVCGTVLGRSVARWLFTTGARAGAAARLSP